MTKTRILGLVVLAFCGVMLALPSLMGASWERSGSPQTIVVSRALKKAELSSPSMVFPGIFGHSDQLDRASKRVLESEQALLEAVAEIGMEDPAGSVDVVGLEDIRAVVPMESAVYSATGELADDLRFLEHASERNARNYEKAMGGLELGLYIGLFGALLLLIGVPRAAALGLVAAACGPLLYGISVQPFRLEPIVFTAPLLIPAFLAFRWRGKGEEQASATPVSAPAAG